MTTPAGMAPVAIPSGNLDPLFSIDGRVTVDLSSGHDMIEGLAIQQDGRILALGTVAGDFALLRLNAYGSPDASFSADGIVITSPGPGNDVAQALAIAADGKILATGYSNLAATHDDFALLRFNADGTPDTGFGSGGKVITPVSAGNVADQAYDIAMQADGRIVVVGNNDFDFLVVRYNADGTLDTSFDQDGIATTTLDNSSAFARAVAIQSDGKILVAGAVFHFDPVESSFDLNLTLTRYLPDGSLDASFDGDGMAVFPMGDDEFAFDMAIDAQGRILLAGEVVPANGDPADIAVWRLTPQGALDTSFGGDGMTRFGTIGEYESANALAIQADGKIFVGATSSAQLGEALLLRLTANGELDASFSGDGQFTAYYGNGTSTLDAMAISGNGDLVVAGSSFNGNDRVFGLMRLAALGDRAAATAGSAFNFVVPSETFFDGDSSFTLSARLAGGGALPAWLTFNPATRAFTGTPSAADFGTLQVQVSATDGEGEALAALQFDVTAHFIQALLPDGEPRWNPDELRGTGTAVTYSFMATAPAYGSANEQATFEAFNQTQRSAAAEVLSLYAGIINVSLSEVPDAGDGGQIRFGRNQQGVEFSGYSSFPANQPAAGDIWIDKTDAFNDAPVAGSFGYEVLVHEVGHALGLKHSFELGTTLPPAEDTRLNTVMSYTDPPNSTYRKVTDLGNGSYNIAYNGVFPETPMIYDIAALQYLYGANSTTHAGDDVYSFDPARPFFRTIWDGDGIDTLSIANFATGSIIDLRDGRLSSLRIPSDPLPPGQTETRTDIYDGSNNLGIAFNTLIENAVGGSGNDEITGNRLANRLEGGGGSDTFIFQSSGNGVDTLADFAAGDRLRIIDTSPSGPIVMGDGSTVALNRAQMQIGATTTRLFIGSDANAGADIEILLSGVMQPGGLRVLGTDIIVNTAPNVAGMSLRSALTGKPLSLTPGQLFSDADAGDLLSFSATGLPAGLGIDNVTGQISGTAPTAAGLHSVTVVATDSGGLATSLSFDLNIATGHAVAAQVLTRGGMPLPGVTAHELSSPTVPGSLFGFRNFSVNAGAAQKTLAVELVASGTEVETQGTFILEGMSSSVFLGFTPDSRFSAENGWTLNQSNTANGIALATSHASETFAAETLLGRINLLLPAGTGADSVLDLTEATLGNQSSNGRSLSYARRDLGTNGQLNAEFADGGVAVALERGVTDLVVAGKKPITAADALDALKLSVGLSAALGQSWKELIAADITRDGRVTAADALEILKVSVGINTLQPSWVFVPDHAGVNPNLPGMTRTAVTYKDDLSLASITGAVSTTITGILVGDVNNSWVIPA